MLLLRDPSIESNLVFNLLSHHRFFDSQSHPFLQGSQLVTRFLELLLIFGPQSNKLFITSPSAVVRPTKLATDSLKVFIRHSSSSKSGSASPASTSSSSASRLHLLAASHPFMSCLRGKSHQHWPPATFPWKAISAKTPSGDPCQGPPRNARVGKLLPRLRPGSRRDPLLGWS